MSVNGKIFNILFHSNTDCDRLSWPSFERTTSVKFYQRKKNDVAYFLVLGCSSQLKMSL
jgi:hypothetical protein